jgi:mRNA interferase HicA
LSLQIGHICTIFGVVNGAQFIRRIRKLGRKRGISVEVVTSRGKGSHVTLLFGSRFTTVPGHRGDLPKGTLAAMLKELGLALSDLG